MIAAKAEDAEACEAVEIAIVVLVPEVLAFSAGVANVVAEDFEYFGVGRVNVLLDEL